MRHICPLVSSYALPPTTDVKSTQQHSLRFVENLSIILSLHSLFDCAAGPSGLAATRKLKTVQYCRFHQNRKNFMGSNGPCGVWSLHPIMGDNYSTTCKHVSIAMTIKSQQLQTLRNGHCIHLVAQLLVHFLYCWSARRRKL